MEPVTAETSAQLLKVLQDHAVPDPAIVGKLPKGGMQLDFVGHAEITRTLIEVDPLWWWEPAAWDGGVPAVTRANGFAHMAGTLYIKGVGRIGVGSVKEDKPDVYKELVSDFLRNAAMRFGIALSLWSKQEWDDLNNYKQAAPAPAQARPQPAKNEKLSDEQLKQFTDACEKAGLNAMEVHRHAGLTIGKATQADLPALRAAFKEMSTKGGE
jgi:hypothetical protein